MLGSLTMAREEKNSTREEGLRAIGCNPANHPAWWTAEAHVAMRERLHAQHRESLGKYIPKSDNPNDAKGA
jgi:hypothetical protein